MKQFYALVGASAPQFNDRDAAIAAARRTVGKKSAYSSGVDKVYIALVTDVVETPLPEAVVTSLAVA